MSISPEQIDQLSQSAWEALENEDFAQARELGSQLRTVPTEFGFRVMAMVHMAEEASEEAIAEIEAGLKAFPQSWSLHMQLGNVYSDLAEWEKAERAFKAALACPEVEEHWVQFNQALLEARRGDIDQSLNLLQQITHPDAHAEAFELKLTILDQAGRHDLMIELAEEELEDLPPPESEEAAAVMGNICQLIGSAYWYEESEEEVIRHYIRQAIGYDRTNPATLNLIREMDPQFGEEVKGFSLLVSGKMEGGTEGVFLDFMTTYALIADHVEEGLEMVKQFEPDYVDTDTLRVEEIEEIEFDAEEPKGIYLVGGFAFVEEA